MEQHICNKILGIIKRSNNILIGITKVSMSKKELYSLLDKLNKSCNNLIGSLKSRIDHRYEFDDGIWSPLPPGTYFDEVK